ncbi:MAG: phosphomannomutase/phosphoglucomutase [Frankiaceae bacterium]|jgi:phosphomannomutase|nr:phosphomannomutase/phosphoglucomutase [Frankiaceae bacterium]
MPSLSSIVKAYDVRGAVPDELDEAAAEALGAATVDVLGAAALVTARDMRASGPALARAFTRGATARGADVIDIGLASTDLLYFASGRLDLPGAMFTASHNPARYNGIKLCRAGAAPVGLESGLAQIRDAAQAYLDAGGPGALGSAAAGDRPAPGAITERTLLREYAEHLRALVDLRGIRPLVVAVDAGNGMAGFTVPAVLGGQLDDGQLGDGQPLEALPLRIVPMYFELDGSFPHHEANPLEPANLIDLRRKVVEVGADIGLAFDGDADRCFVVDAAGEPVSPSAITALVAARELARNPGGTIIHNLITSAAVPQIVREHGGVPVRTRVGHSYIKAEMARTGALFGGEHSAHYYFRDFWRADTGMLAAMHVLAALGEQPGSLAELTAQYSRYAASGEINTAVADQDARVAAVRAAYADAAIGMDTLDGLTVLLPDSAWFNVRASNTEPLLRLNVEAATPAAMGALRDAVLAIIRG